METGLGIIDQTRRMNPPVKVPDELLLPPWLEDWKSTRNRPSTASWTTWDEERA